MTIAFSIPTTCKQSADNVAQLLLHPEQLAQQRFKKESIAFFEQQYPGYKALLTPSCTRALELAAMATGLNANDEVIMPSFGFVGMANAFANTGASIVFADILPHTMNIDPNSVERCIGAKTRAVVIMHYAGVACNTSALRSICDRHGLLLIEDNAQGIGCLDGHLPLGSVGDFTCISFDPMKNISCGEGGLLLCKQHLWPQVITVFNNGTDREAFEQGHKNRYEWVAPGSKFEMSEHTAALLLPLLYRSSELLDQRRKIWQQLYEGMVQAQVPEAMLPAALRHLPHKGHLFFIHCANDRALIMQGMQSAGVACASHFAPLHSSPRAKAAGWRMDCDIHTTSQSDSLLRLPVHNHLTQTQITHICTTLSSVIKHVTTTHVD